VGVYLQFLEYVSGLYNQEIGRRELSSKRSYAQIYSQKIISESRKHGCKTLIMMMVKEM